MYAAGVKQHAYDGASVHAYRHTFAGALLDEGADPRDLQEALGHSSPQTSWTYTKRRRNVDKLAQVMGKTRYRA